eukprot:7762233-Pyramimonas_sp.AAC.1
MVMPDMDKNMHVVLVIVDIASDFTMAIYARPGSRPTAELAEKALELGWLTRAGPTTVVAGPGLYLHVQVRDTVQRPRPGDQQRHARNSLADGQ